jgi:hypothetical protein
VKIVSLPEANLDECLKAAQHDGVLVKRRGKPYALVLGVQGLDEEQIELGQSDKFWKLVRKWRRQKTISRAELDRRLAKKS